MGQGRYSLDRLFHLRVREAEQAAVVLQRSVDVVHTEQSRLDGLHKQRMDWVEHQLQLMDKGSVTVSSLRQSVEYQNYFDQQIQQQSNRLQHAENEMRESLQDWQKRSKDEKILQKHRDRNLAQMAVEKGRATQKELDDISAIYYRRSQM